MATQYMGGTRPKSSLASYYKLASGVPSGAYAGGPASYRGLGAPRATTAAQQTAGLPAPKPASLGSTSMISQLAQAANAAAQPAAPPPNRYEGIGKIDYSSDPVLAQVRTLGLQSVPDAIAQADAARKQLLIQYGDPNLARSAVFGGRGFSMPGIQGGPDFTIADTSHVGDEGSALAAQQNPFSTVARLADAHKLTGHDLDEALNRQGLYYSGERVRQLGLEDKNYQGQQADAAAAEQAAWANIDASLMGAYQNAGAGFMDAETAAYLRALAAAGSGGGGGGGVAAPINPVAVVPGPAAPPVAAHPTVVSRPAAAALASIPILGAISGLAVQPRKLPQNSRPGGRGGV